MGWVASATPAPAVQATPNPCVVTDPHSREVIRIKINDGSTTVVGPSLPFNPVNYAALLEVAAQTITFPPVSFLLQSGSIAPIYPTKNGTFVYDTQLNKWGKSAGDYLKLFEMFPINSQSSPIIPFDVFGSDTAVLKSDGLIYLHDKYPTESKITYGKIGYYRKGMTDADEVRVQFGEPASGFIELSGSLDGKLLSPLIQNIQNVDTVYFSTLYANASARWYNVSISGIFDITGLEFRGHLKGRR